MTPQTSAGSDSPHNPTKAKGEPQPKVTETEYQTYREALSLIRFGLAQNSQIEAFDFLADIYKKAPLRLKAVFVMALISTLTSFSFMDIKGKEHEGIEL